MPDLVEALAGLGRLLCGSDRAEEAIQLLAAAVETSAGEAVLFRSLGMAYEAAGKKDEAAAALERAEKLEAALISMPGNSLH